jgi:YidC/Oxa1 family membrane protein insertase
MFPFGIKQQKNSQKQAKLRPKENVIRKKYAGRNDKATQMKMNTEIQELYQKENFNPLGGCLPLLLSMFVLFSVYSVVRSPLTYTAAVPTTEQFQAADVATSAKRTVSIMIMEEEKANGTLNVERLKDYLNISRSDKTPYTAEDFETDFWNAYNAGSFSTYAEINSIGYIQENKEAFIAKFDSMTHYKTADPNDAGTYFGAEGAVNGRAIVDNLPDMVLFDGFDIGIVPEVGVLTAQKIGTKVLILVPILSLVTAYFGQAITRKFTYQPEQSAEMKSQARIMNLFMPLFGLFISCSVPDAVGIYWMMSNILSPVQQIALSKLYPIAEITPEEMREAERFYGGKQKKKKGTSANTKKKKSLVYDDDEDEKVSAPAPKKKPLKEKADAEEGVIEKAPLKEE